MINPFYIFKINLLKQALGMVREHPLQVRSDELAMSYSGDGLARAFA